jgi:hypothetical protein
MFPANLRYSGGGLVPLAAAALVGLTHSATWPCLGPDDCDRIDQHFRRARREGDSPNRRQALGARPLRLEKRTGEAPTIPVPYRNRLHRLGGRADWRAPGPRVAQVGIIMASFPAISSPMIHAGYTKSGHRAS